MPEISIITPAFIDNQQKKNWLWEAIQSVQDQDFKDWEMIIVDDCSPVDLSEIKSSYDPDKIRWFRTPRRSGPALARNTGVALAEAEALLPLDADDQLAGRNVLLVMYDAWLQDRTQIIYGDIQRLENSGQRGKVYGLPDYTFQKILDLGGIIPVTALHSRDCHIKAGGWKGELSAGLEDVEYWIAAGKAGFCGHRIQVTSLLYRRHETSRSYALRSINRRETEMRNRIMDMHRDVFEGRYPVSCCGGGKPYIPPQNYQNQNISLSTTLDGYPSDQKVWVQYLGRREGSFDVVGDSTNTHYQIQGNGHKFEVHRSDISKFRRSGRGQDFAIGVHPPEEIIAEMEIAAQEKGEEARYQGPEPVLAEIERLDRVAAQARGIPWTGAPAASPKPELAPEPNFILQGRRGNGQTNLINDSSKNYQDDPLAGAIQGRSVVIEPVSLRPPIESENYDLSPLDLGEKIQGMLQAESWSVEKLAGAGLNELTAYPGIGPKIAEKIIKSAKEFLANG